MVDITGRYEISRSVEDVWAMLNDPEVLRRCIPGCQDLTATGQDSYSARVQLRLGPVKATFAGEVEMTDIVYPRSFRLGGEGRGGVAGLASGYADVVLEPAANGTVLTYSAKAQVAGKIAQLGSRLIDSTSRKLADQFFDRFEQLARGEAA